jgi:hypothetical protein
MLRLVISTAWCDETAWWKNVGIDPSITARALWLDTHPLPSAQTPQAGAVTTLPKIFSRPLARITVENHRRSHYVTKPIDLGRKIFRPRRAYGLLSRSPRRRYRIVLGLWLFPDRRFPSAPRRCGHTWIRTTGHRLARAARRLDAMLAQV